MGGEVNQDCDGTETCYAAADADGFTDDASTVVSTDPDCIDLGEGTANDPTGECDDTDTDPYPGAPEVEEDGIDQDGEDLALHDGGDRTVMATATATQPPQDAAVPRREILPGELGFSWRSWRS